MSFKKFFNRSNIQKYKILTKEINHQFEKIRILDNIDFAKELLTIKENSALSNKKKTILAMAYAKKASLDILGMPYYDVQLIGALSLVDGCIAEMKTGEGKTLTCTAAVVANYVLGYSTHVATANEYLAERDHDTLVKLYQHLGLSSSYITSKATKEQKKELYKSNIVYSTAQEFGFDFLRDNLIYNLEEKIQPHSFKNIKCIIDEADFILIDEARTPLIISGESPTRDAKIYETIHQFAKNLVKMDRIPNNNRFNIDDHIFGDYWLDEKYKAAYLSESGYASIEQLSLDSGLLLSNKQGYAPTLYQSENSWIINEVLNALKAEFLYSIDKDYVVVDNTIVIIDQNTGRLSHGRTWSNGLHQAIEVKESIKINPESMTLGSISIQNYFRNYIQISGMSGTIMESSEEFEDIYQCKTIQIPTNKNMIRIDKQDQIYLTIEAKYKALIEDIITRHNNSQPILIGTTSVAESETVSNLLSQHNIKHHVLNAKNNVLEAQIIAQAGQPYSVTVATSMAGRGTDIILGGNQEVLTLILDKQLLEIESCLFKAAEITETVHQLTDFSIPITPIHTINSIKPDLFQTSNNQDEIDLFNNHSYLLQEIEKDYIFVWNKLFNIKQNILKQKENIHTLWIQWRQQVLNTGGLCVIGSSRNESRRIDDQLRGRAGRQGDPGESVFYLSIKDSWVNVFGSNPIFNHLAKTMPAHQAISSPSITKAFAKIQRKIEGYHSESRKNTYQYDSIADEGRKQFLNLRYDLLANINHVKEILHEQLFTSLYPILNDDFLYYFEDKHNLQTQGKDTLNYLFNLSVKELLTFINEFQKQNVYHKMDIKHDYPDILNNFITDLLNTREPHIWEQLNNYGLVFLDKLWTEHLGFIDEAQQNVGFRAIAQKNPLYEYKKICFDSFVSMLSEFRNKIEDEFLNFTSQPELNPSYDLPITYTIKQSDPEAPNQPVRIDLPF